MNKWQPKRRLETQYAKAIQRLIQGLQAEMKAARSPFQLVRIIRAYARSPSFLKSAEKIARAMVTHVFSDGHITWRQAAWRASKSRLVYLALTKEMGNNPALYKLIERNARYISSMPDTVAKRVVHRVNEEQAKGRRPEDIISDLLAEWPKLTRSHARLIARTEVSKAASTLTQVRSQEAGVDWYVWRTSEDARVRHGHRRMDGVLIHWNDAPSPEALVKERDYGKYHAGCTFNCRCYAEPLLDYADISWPHEVYMNGEIKMMTLAQFKRMTGGATA